MAHWKAVFVLSCVLAGSLVAAADKYTDENRPYEFGFSIDGEQHRHEKKDENGIIMGEFGFITADGVYHVTVYATDENGNFKIISMKNIRVKPYPTAASAKDTRTGHALSISPQTPASTTLAAPAQTALPYSKTTPPPQQTKKPISPLLEPARACSHCSLPTTTTVKPIYADANDGDGTPNKEKGFGTSGNTNDFGLNKENNFKSISNEPISNTGSNGIPNSRVTRPQTNVYNSPNLSDGVSLIPNISQLPLDYNAQSYDPLDQSGFRQRYPTEQSNQNNYQNSLGSTLPESLQGNSPQQKKEQQTSSIDNNKSRPQFGNAPSIANSVNEYSNGNKNDPPNAVGGSVGNRENENERSRGPINTENTSNNQNNPQNTVGNYSPVANEDNAGERSPKQLTSFGQTQYGGQNEESSLGTSNNGKPNKPVLISAQMQIVDKNTDVYSKKPGEKDGLPNGLTKGDMENLLYTFNYTLAFHGHYEEGYTNGAKQGYYFVTGRNGVRTRIDYIADENGFRPKITQEVLDLISEDVPKPETEKDEKYGLKGYEFKWLYFPVGSKQ